MNDGPLLDYDEAGKYLLVSRSTLKTLAGRGEIERFRISEKRVVFTRESLDAYIERQRGK